MRTMIIIALIGVLALASCQTTSAEDMVVFCQNLGTFNDAYAYFSNLDDDSSPEETESAHNELVATGHELEVSSKNLNDPVIDTFVDAAKKLNTAIQSLPMNVIISPNSTTSLSASMANISQEREDFQAAYETLLQTTCK